MNYRITQKLGRLADGFEGGHGTKNHALPFGSYKALCGTKPGRRSVGWSDYNESEVTCPGCLKKLAKLEGNTRQLQIHAEIDNFLAENTPDSHLEAAYEERTELGE